MGPITQLSPPPPLPAGGWVPWRRKGGRASGGAVATAYVDRQLRVLTDVTFLTQLSPPPPLPAGGWVPLRRKGGRASGGAVATAYVDRQLRVLTDVTFVSVGA
ncbi:hypothetical protein V498_04410 [Pseudogymnoascus sp. VKM F-4517 (FW-2822)]|nr:hypothetical protein V498_04410 [Pseudogymnoascus sp. VKM F-4517 (FW-2822)]